MDRKSLMNRLDRVRLHVEEGALAIERQLQVVRQEQLAGRDATEAAAFLTILEDTQRVLETHCQRLEMRLGQS